MNSLYFHSGHQKVILYPIICIDCLWNCNALYHKPGCAVINICTILLFCFLFFLIKFHFLKNESYFVVFICGGKMTINSKYLQPHNGHFLLWIVKKKGKICEILHYSRESPIGIIYSVIDLFLNLQTGEYLNHYINKYWTMCWRLNEFKIGRIRIKQ